MWDQDDLDVLFSNLAPQIPNGTHPTDDSIDVSNAFIRFTDPHVALLTML